MGWLRDAWSDIDARSPDDLARRVQAHPGWPTDLQLGVRSFGNRIRELDRGRGAAWWLRDERAPVIDTLAAVLGWKPDAVRAAIAGEFPAAGSPRLTAEARHPLAALGRLRPLQLESESPPPGVPEAALLASRWRRHWWCTADRQARELVARWLARRERATVIVTSSLREALDVMPERGRVMLVLGELPSPDEQARFLSSPALDDVQLCVAAPFWWRAPSGAQWPGPAPRGGGFTAIEDPPPSRWLEALLAWAVGRCSQGRQPRLERVREVVEALGPARFAGPCELVELVGLVAHLDGRRPLPTTRARWVECVVSTRAAAVTGVNKNQRTWLNEHAASVYLELCASTLRDPPRQRARGLARAEWSARLPEQHVPAHDIANARSVLGQAAGDAQPETLERLQRLLAPDTEVVLDALAAAGLLVEHAPGRLRLEPAWAARVAHEAMFIKTCRSELRPELGHLRELGELLARPHLAGEALELLVARFLEGDFDALTRLHVQAAEHGHDPVAVLAIEACVRAYGLALLVLQGLDEARVDAAQLEPVTAAVWAAMHRTLIEIPGQLPRPSLWLTSDRDAPDLCDDGLFYLAALALGESRQLRTRSNPLYPWGALREPNRRQLEVLRRIGDGLAGLDASRHAEALQAGAARLGLRLTDRETPWGPTCATSQLVLPGYLFNVVERMGLEPDERLRALVPLVDGVEDPGRLLRALDAIGLHRWVRAENVLGALWSVWEERERDGWAPASWLPRAPEAARRLWRHAPAGAVELVFEREPLIEDVARATDERRSLVALALSERRWSEWARAWARRVRTEPSIDHAYLAFWSCASVDAIDWALEHVLGEGGELPAHETMALCWRRAPERVLARLERFEREVAMRWIELAPAGDDALQVALTDAVARWIGDRVVNESLYPRVLSWLHERARTRRDGWERAYALLVELARPSWQSLRDWD
ncbi:MAG: hypothetical protein H6713_00590 [Myxococcales bacterium]|nr:hypothetical protein [Myxococcales bacterium]